MRARVVLRLDAELDEPIPISPPLREASERRAARDEPVAQRPDVEVRIDVHRVHVPGRAVIDDCNLRCSLGLGLHRVLSFRVVAHDPRPSHRGLG